MKEEKLKQLKVVFKVLINDFINELDSDYKEVGDAKLRINSLANKFIYEVKIRINNKQEANQ